MKLCVIDETGAPVAGANLAIRYHRRRDHRSVYLPFPKWTIVTALVTLSTVKFMFVIFYFMQLRWDKPFCTILFFIGLILAAGTMWALLTLFGAEASIPLPT